MQVRKTCLGIKSRCLDPPGNFLCIPEPGRPGCVISLEKGVKPVDATSAEKKLVRKLSFPLYTPPPGFKGCYNVCVYSRRKRMHKNIGSYIRQIVHIDELDFVCLRKKLRTGTVNIAY